jgi:small subunit ribosomal protein S6
MYILASSVSDDQVPAMTDQVSGFITDLGGTDLVHTALGKKKLAYPIRKTRNGHYGLAEFTMDSRKVNDLDAKIRTQDNTIIRHMIVNIDEHLQRSAKDKAAQDAMNKNRPPEKVAADKEANNPTSTPRAEAPAPKAKAEAAAPVEATEEAPKKAAKKAVSDADLDSEIEKALTEDIA